MIQDTRYNPQPVKSRTSCPSCGGAITPEQDAKIRDRETQLKEFINGQIKQERWLSRANSNSNVTFGDSPPPNSGLKYTAVMPPEGMKYVYNQETGERSTVPIDKNKGYEIPENKQFPINDLWDRKRDDKKEVPKFYQGSSAAEQKRGTTWGSVPKPPQPQFPEFKPTHGGWSDKQQALAGSGKPGDSLLKPTAKESTKKKIDYDRMMNGMGEKPMMSTPDARNLYEKRRRVEGGARRRRLF